MCMPNEVRCWCSFYQWRNVVIQQIRPVVPNEHHVWVHKILKLRIWVALCGDHNEPLPRSWECTCYAVFNAATIDASWLTYVCSLSSNLGFMCSMSIWPQVQVPCMIIINPYLVSNLSTTVFGICFLYHVFASCLSHWLCYGTLHELIRLLLIENCLCFRPDTPRWRRVGERVNLIYLLNPVLRSMIIAKVSDHAMCLYQMA